MIGPSTGSGRGPSTGSGRGAAAGSGRVPALGLAALLTFTGSAHLARPGTFDAALPGWLPGGRRVWEVGSGLAELACAIAVAVPATRRLGGYATAALFVAVFPGNLHMVRTARTPRARAITLARLPLQVPLVRWAWWVARQP